MRKLGVLQVPRTLALLRSDRYRDISNDKPQSEWEEQKNVQVPILHCNCYNESSSSSTTKEGHSKLNLTWYEHDDLRFPWKTDKLKNVPHFLRVIYVSFD